MRHRALASLILVVAAVAVSGCGSSDPIDAGAPSTDPPVTAAPTTTLPSPRITTVFEHVDYYGACGNETVVVGGTTLYPLFPDEMATLDIAAHPTGTTAPAGFVRTAPAVVAPGPGDDVGTMVLYDDGIARFESESGRVLWLTTAVHEYDWVC